MIAAWMLYSTAVGALIGAGALAGHYVCRVLRLPARWIWAAGMVMTLALSSGALLRLAWGSAAAPAPVGVAMVEQATADGTSMPAANAIADFIIRVAGLAALGADRLYAAAAGSAADGRGVAAVWLLASAGLFVLLCGTLLRLRRARRTWASHRIGDVPVLVSRDVGPALVGLVRPSIVVPAWLLAEPEERQRLVVQHEGEHRRAGDHILLAAACVIVCVLPWNIALWWMLLRIRLAVELDCDARVLRRGVKPRSYGSLLLEIAGRTRARPFGAPALADSDTHLERRLIAMTEGNRTPHRIRAAGAGMSGFLLVTAACAADLPTAAAIDDMNVEQARAQAEQVGILAPLPANEAPLYIVDGVIVAEDAARGIAPTEISSIEIVKAPAALYEYGDRAEHGVVFIRTRSGEPVESGGPVESGVLVESVDREAPDNVKSPLGEAILERADRSGQVRIRGIREGSPLFIVDGVIASESFALRTLSPESIQSIEILKGAAARILHDDPRAVNGVIRITTKTGGK